MAKTWQKTVLSPIEETKALDAVPFADLRGQLARDILCNTQAEISFKAGMRKVVEWVEIEMNKIEADERYHQPTATIDINAPLALIQLSMEAQMLMLRQLQSQLKEWGIE